MKKYLIVLISIIALVSLTVLTSCGDLTGEKQFALNEDGESYRFAYKGKAKTVEIPNEYEGLPVTHIGHWAFTYASEVETVIIPKSITNISSVAFTGYDAALTNTIKKIKYKGTIAEWETIEKEHDWDICFVDCKIICSDGEIEIKK